MNLHNQKTVLEDYLQQEENSNKLKQEKLKKKRYKKREKKKTKKNSSNNNDTDTEENPPEISEPNNCKLQKNFTLHLSNEKMNNNRRFLDEIPEKEREFLIKMGWGDEEYEEEITDHEINIIQMKRKEIQRERESFRRKLNEKFLKLIQKS